MKYITMKDNFGDIDDKELIKCLTKIITETRDEDNDPLILFGRVAVLSDVLNVMSDEQLLESGDLVENSFADRWTEDISDCVLEGRFADFCEIIKTQLLNEERFEVIVSLEKSGLI